MLVKEKRDTQIFHVLLQGLAWTNKGSSHAQIPSQGYQQYERSNQYRLKNWQSYRNVCQWELPRWTPGKVFKRTIINFIKEFEEFKENTKKQFNESKEEEFKANKYLNDAPRTQTLRFMETMRTMELENSKP